jgi:hypothetical protein
LQTIIRRHRVRIPVFRALAAFAALCATAVNLSAQQNAGRFQGASVDEGAKKLNVGAPQQDLSALGHVLAPGILFSPTITMEAGFNSNPDEYFSDAEGSPYGLTNSTNVFGFLGDQGATTLTLRTTFLQYSGDIIDNHRWDAGAALDNAYTLAPGTLATFGIYYLRDELSFVPSDNSGAYGQLGFREDGFESFVRLKTDQIDYLGSVVNASFTPTQLMLIQPSQFNFNRIEGASGFIFGPQARLGFYGELGGANLDYYDQGVENFLDRDASQIWGIAGMRFNLHPTLTFDAGWRLNVRQVEDKSVDDQTTSFFDGSLTWTPIPTFSLTAEIDRTFVEPSSIFAIMTDKIHYGMSAAYQLRPDLQIGVALRHDQKEQIGDIYDYHETEVSLVLGYQWSEKTLIYGLALHELVDEQTTGQSSEKFQVGAGTRMKF